MRRSKCVPEAVRSLRVWEDKLPRSGEDAGRRKVRQGVGRNQASQEDPFNLASKAGPFLDAPTCFTAVGVSFHPRSSQNADNQNTSVTVTPCQSQGSEKRCFSGEVAGNASLRNGRAVLFPCSSTYFLPQLHHIPYIKS